MKNQECYDKNGNFIGWFSRSVAVVGIPILKENEQYYILASQRGEGTPDEEYRGMWNLCCGYLDFDETTEEAVIREIKEETGVDLNYEHIELIGINSDPTSDKRQNVSFSYLISLSHDKLFYEEQFSHANNEKDEVGDIAFININDVDKYQWAFNHVRVISLALSQYWTNEMNERTRALIRQSKKLEI